MFFFLVLLFFWHGENQKMMEITDSISDDIIANQKYLILNFYVNWCRFCVILKPEYDAAAKIINENYTDALLTKINCEVNLRTCNKYKVNKYPTLMIFRHGTSKKEYRGERTSQAIIKFVVKDMRTEPLEVQSLDQVDKTHDYIFGLFSDRSSHEYSEFAHVLMEYIDECLSYVIFKPGSKTQVSFVSHSNPDQPDIFRDHISSAEFESWVEDHCRPMIHEITFRNAEELTDDGIPLLLLFYNIGDEEAKRSFLSTIKKNKDLWEGKYKPVYAKATVFEHALRRLKKTPNDAPLIVVDDYNHLYEFGEISKFNDRDEIIKFFDIIRMRREEISLRFQQIIFGAFDVHPPALPNPEEKLEEHYKKKAKEVGIPSEPSRAELPTPDTKGDAESQDNGFTKSIFKILAPNEKRYTMARERDEL